MDSDFDKTTVRNPQWEFFFKCGQLSIKDGDFEVAETHLKKALDLVEQNGSEDLRISRIYTVLADLSIKQGFPERAEDYYKMAIDRWEKCMGGFHVGLIEILEKFGDFLTKMDRNQEAETIRFRMESIQESQEN